MKIQHFLQLIRYKNLLMLALVQLLFSLVFLYQADFNIVKLVLLIQTTLLLAAAGNVINDFFDVETDKINSPNKVLIGNIISGKTALSIYYVLNFFGIISGITLAYLHHKVGYGLLFIAISTALFYYSKSLKKIALLGNFIVSFFIALSILFIYIFPPFSFSDTYNSSFTTIITSYAAFAFMLNFIREIVKDIEDVDGDYIQKMKTLPILIGRKRTKKVVFYLSFIPFITIILLISLLNKMLLTSYAFVCIVIPLGYFIFQIKEVDSKNKIHKLSTLLKIIMLLGIVSVLFLKI